MWYAAMLPVPFPMSIWIGRKQDMRHIIKLDSPLGHVFLYLLLISYYLSCNLHSPLWPSNQHWKAQLAHPNRHMMLRLSPMPLLLLPMLIWIVWIVQHKYIDPSNQSSSYYGFYVWQFLGMCFQVGQFATKQMKYFFFSWIH